MLKPEVSLTVALATSAVVFGIYQTMLPRVADVRDTEPNDDGISSMDKQAGWASAAVVAGVSLIAKDPTIFILGGATIVAMSWFYKHGNTVNPQFGMAVPKGDNLPEQFDETSMGEAENYANQVPATGGFF